MTVPTTRVPMQVTRGCLVASIQGEIGTEMLRAFRADLLARVRDTDARGVILDLSGVEVMDAVEFDSLRHTMDMVALMGAAPLLVGLRAGIVSALVDLEANVDSVRTAFDVDQAFDLLAGRQTGAASEKPLTDGPEADAYPHRR
jgi:rsbT antagonist protein RsbS